MSGISGPEIFIQTVSVLKMDTELLFHGKTALNPCWNGSCYLKGTQMRLFSTFSSTIAQVPPQVVPKTLELQRKMLETDIALKRTLPMAEVNSILSFCRFMDAVRQGTPSVPTVAPGKHLEFYRETIERMVEADVLPAVVLDEFELIFSKPVLTLKPAMRAMA